MTIYFKQSDKDNDTLVMKNGLRIFPGMEIAVTEGGHVLVISDLNTIRKINRGLNSFKNPASYMAFESLMTFLGDYPVLKGVAHPYREGDHIP